MYGDNSEEAYIGPLGQRFIVLVPWNLNTNGVADHSIKIRVICGSTVKKFPP